MSQHKYPIIWEKLRQHADALKQIHLRDLFVEDSQRFQRFCRKQNGILIDFSKNFLNETTFELFIELANTCGLRDQIEALFRGDKLNHTENRAAWHTALRQPETTIDIKQELNRMKIFVNRVLSGEWVGFSGKRITDIVNIGIGGSHLGAALLTEALTAYRTPLNIHFASNADGISISSLITKLNPETTLFIITSKTFSTQETLLNAKALIQWFEATSGHSPYEQHVIGVSANSNAMTAFGLPLANQFRFWDFVVGRFSIWSTVGLVIALAIGFDQFEALLQGAAEMDEHFRQADFKENIPFLMALLDIFYINFWQAQTHAILPYHSHLKLLPGYLQQLCMESLGKSINNTGHEINYHTGNIIWGDLGSNGQHAFYQLLHQGKFFVPIDFIVPIQLEHHLSEYTDFNIANVLAQSQALMAGKNSADVYQEMEQQGVTKEEITRLLPHRVYPGNRPSTMIVLNKLTPETMGQLIALYEHKVFVQSVIWDINPFDQWGIELGKSLTKQYLSLMQNSSATDGILAHVQKIMTENQ